MPKSPDSIRRIAAHAEEFIAIRYARLKVGVRPKDLSRVFGSRLRRLDVHTIEALYPFFVKTVILSSAEGYARTLFIPKDGWDTMREATRRDLEYRYSDEGQRAELRAPRRRRRAGGRPRTKPEPAEPTQSTTDLLKIAALGRKFSMTALDAEE